MSERRFTPGPWRWDEEAGCFIVDAKGNAVAEINCQSGNRSDGPLIAAAPEMYEALWATEKVIASFEKAIKAENGPLLPLIRAALKKALS